jgi:hypothetical protein
MDFFAIAERGVEGVSSTFHVYLCLYLNSMFYLVVFLNIYLKCYEIDSNKISTANTKSKAFVKGLLLPKSRTL